MMSLAELGIAILQNLMLIRSDHCHLCSKSLFCRFLVAVGSFTTSPSNPLLISTWQPSLDVSVNPNARSNMSFSSSDGSGIISYIPGSVMITWQVEQAQLPPQAPSTSRSYACAMSSRLAPSATSNVCDLPALSIKVTLRLRKLSAL